MLTAAKKEFIEFMMGADVLRFGNFVTKSGRNTPYFVNTGNYKTGAQAAKLGDYYAACIQHIERYQAAIAANGSRLVHEYDKKMLESSDYSLIAEANRKLSAMARTEATATLGKVLREGSLAMKCGYKRSDN